MVVVVVEGVVEEEEKMREKEEVKKFLWFILVEGVRIVMEICKEGMLLMLFEDGWFLGMEVRFVVDIDGNFVLCL